MFLTDLLDESAWERLAKKLDYCKLDLVEADEYQKLMKYIKSPERITISYFAIPPSLYAQTCQNLSSVRGLNYSTLPGGFRKTYWS
ncbi:hypothetical protein [Legionella sp.]|uniref:hypothetical protein n=1 Tax=Legionella sp. TaxID=459 RepID=UPI003CC504B9